MSKTVRQAAEFHFYILELYCNICHISTIQKFPKNSIAGTEFVGCPIKRKGIERFLGVPVRGSPQKKSCKFVAEGIFGRLHLRLNKKRTIRPPKKKPRRQGGVLENLPSGSGGARPPQTHLRARER